MSIICCLRKNRRILILLLAWIICVFVFVFSKSANAVDGYEGNPFSTCSYKFPGAYPSGVAYDGNYFWGADMVDKKIYQISPRNGNIIKTIPSPGKCPLGLAWDGRTLWNVDSCKKSWADSDKRDSIYRINPENGSIISIISAPSTNSRGLTWDGSYLWIADSGTRKIYKINADDGKIIDFISTPGRNPTGLAWDGRHLWNADVGDNKIYELDPSTGDIINRFPSPSSAPYGLAYFDQYIWHTDKKEDKIYKLCFTNELFIDDNLITPVKKQDEDRLRAEIKSDELDKSISSPQEDTIEDEVADDESDDENTEIASQEQEEGFELAEEMDEEIPSDPAIKWSDNIIKVEGLAFFKEDIDDNRLEEGRQAIKEAEENAYKKLFQVVSKIRLNAKKSIGDYIKSDTRLRKKIQEFVSNATIVDKRYLEMGARVVLKVKLNGPQNSLASIIGRNIKP